jgi:hypothetical protein
MAATLCTVTGTLYEPDGSTLGSETLYLSSLDYKDAGDGIARGTSFTSATDVSGGISFSVVKGEYYLWTDGTVSKKIKISVPDAASAEIQDIVSI